jgi:hypothetical protein
MWTVDCIDVSHQSYNVITRSQNALNKIDDAGLLGKSWLHILGIFCTACGDSDVNQARNGNRGKATHPSLSFESR